MRLKCMAISIAVGATACVNAQSGVVPAARIVPGQLIVKTKSGTLPFVLAGVLKAKVTTAIRADNVLSVNYSGVSLEQALSMLRSNPDVVYAQPNYYVRYKLVPNDPSFSQQYGLERMRVPQAWDIFTGNPSIITAVLDSGVNAAHEDLAPNLVAGSFNADANNANVEDTDGHGTHVAGIASAVTNNGRGVAAAGFRSRFFAVKVQTSLGSAIGIRYAADRGARIVNMSYGVPFLQAEADACTYAWNKGVLLVSAAGNENSNDPAVIGFPALHREVINVGSTNQTDGKSDFSNFGPTVTIAAPGSAILSTYIGGPDKYSVLQGTSMASPNVCAVAALVWGRNPNLSNQRVKEILHNTADPVGSWVVRGRVNALRAVQAASPLERTVSAPIEVRVGQSSGTTEGTLVSSFGSSALAAASIAAKDSQQYRVRSVAMGTIGQVASVEAVVKVNQPARLMRQLNIEVSSTLPTTSSGIVFVYDYTTQQWTQVGTIAGQGSERDSSVSITRESFSKVINSSGHIRVYIRSVQPRRIRTTQFMFDVNRVAAVGFFDPTGNP